MYRLMRLAPVLAVALLLSGCNNNDNVVAPPPTDTTKTDTFSGTLSLNGGTSYPFTVTATGDITAHARLDRPCGSQPGDVERQHLPDRARPSQCDAGSGRRRRGLGPGRLLRAHL